MLPLLGNDCVAGTPQGFALIASPQYVDGSGAELAKAQAVHFDTFSDHHSGSNVIEQLVILMRLHSNNYTQQLTQTCICVPAVVVNVTIVHGTLLIVHVIPVAVIIVDITIVINVMIVVGIVFIICC
jgi:hypothetical protein